MLRLRAQMYHILRVLAFICNFIIMPLKTIRNNEPNKLNSVVCVIVFELFIKTSIIKNSDRQSILETKFIII